MDPVVHAKRTHQKTTDDTVDMECAWRGGGRWVCGSDVRVCRETLCRLAIRGGYTHLLCGLWKRVTNENRGPGSRGGPPAPGPAPRAQTKTRGLNEVHSTRRTTPLLHSFGPRRPPAPAPRAGCRAGPAGKQTIPTHNHHAVATPTVSC